MAATTPYLKTQQVADALGIGVSTLKRWIDAGQLAASRTVGRHRLIARDEAIRFARLNKLPTAGLEAAGDPARLRVDARAKEDLAATLKAGRSAEARRMVGRAHAALGSGAALGDELIAPLMRSIGHGWSVGSWDVFEEHLATQILAASIAELIARVPFGESPGPLALGASPEGDHYVLPTLLGELTLREGGWDVNNLGTNLPLRSYARAIRATRPRLVFLATSQMDDPIRFLDQYDDFARAARSVGAAILLGGRGLPEALLPRLDHDEYGMRLARMAEFGSRRIAAARAPNIETTGNRNLEGENR